LWNKIWKARDRLSVNQTVCHDCDEWERAALELLAVADEASSGMGFGSISIGRRPEKKTAAQRMSFNYILMQEMVNLQRHSEKMQGLGGRKQPRNGFAAQHANGLGLLRHLPNSICINVPPDVACVQPKTNTPRVGRALRSLSHNLALLPGVGTVETIWKFGTDEIGDDCDSPRRHPLNVLLLPVPYHLHGRAFKEVEDKSNGLILGPGNNGYFTVEQSWLRDERTKRSLYKEIAHWTKRMVHAAERATGPVHAVVFPEAALDWPTFHEVGRAVADEFAHFELLIAGVMIEDRDGFDRNVAATRRYKNGELLFTWPQSKHHPWRLDSSQIRNYHIGHALSPHREWWEAIDVSRRQCTFSVVRPGASLAVLICEDLARVDPVLPAINAIGPNLLIALLMDSAQLDFRWPARYASVLAEDPGCAVLTFTSAGPISRSRPMAANDDGRRAVALWKEPGGGPARSLYMERDSQAVVLSLVTRDDTQYTLDGRSDRGATQSFSLGAAVSVQGPPFPVRL
jgi:hypothetical protein